VEESPIVWAVAIRPGRPEYLYIGTLGDGLLRSSDGGEHFVEAIPALRKQLVYALVARRGGSFYAGTAGSGVLRSRDSGRSWTEMNDGLDKRVVKALVSDRKEGTLYVAAQEQFMGGRGGIFKSTEDGEAFREVTPPTFGEHVISLAVDPVNPHVVLAGTEEGTILRTVDGGLSWTERSLEVSIDEASPIQRVMHGRAIFTLVFDSGEPSVIYAGTGGGGVFKSLDGGWSWSDRNRGLTDLRVRALAVDPDRRGTLYAGTGDFGEGGVFRSDDGGLSWEPTALTDRWVLSLAIAPGEPQSLYAGTENGVLRSVDRGDTWSAVIPGNEPRYVLTLMVEPSLPGFVFGGTEGSGIFRIEVGSKSVSPGRPRRQDR
jgi:photosystem II stability/assembly factor-like uncharacterized protein